MSHGLPIATPESGSLLWLPSIYGLKIPTAAVAHAEGFSSTADTSSDRCRNCAVGGSADGSAQAAIEAKTETTKRNCQPCAGWPFAFALVKPAEDRGFEPLRGRSAVRKRDCCAPAVPDIAVACRALLLQNPTCVRGECTGRATRERLRLGITSHRQGAAP